MKFGRQTGRELLENKRLLLCRLIAKTCVPQAVIVFVQTQPKQKKYDCRPEREVARCKLDTKT